MSKFRDLCVKYYCETDFYTILGISKDAVDQEVRKAYHKLSLKVHPDRVDEKLKEEATEKFKILGRIYSILSSTEKRSIYDQTGLVDEDEGDFDEEGFDWLNYWKCIFKPLSQKDYRDYETKYKGSEEEAIDLKKAYVNGKGDMDFILETVPFTSCDEEDRYKEIIQKYIDSGEVPLYDCFINENPRKTTRRRKKYEKEAALSALVASPADKEESGEEVLREMIASRQRDRGEQMNSFFDRLAEKYGGNSGKSTPKKAPVRKRKRND